MSVRIADDAIYLEGRCMVEDAELLLVAIQQNPGLPIDLAQLQRAHMAVVQVVLALKLVTRDEPSDTFLSRHVFGRGLDSDKRSEPA